MKDSKQKKDWTPYIKPTRRKHDSGYRMFEVGYCVVSGAKVVDKKVIGGLADHIYEDYGSTLLEKEKWMGINIDLTVDGYIRFFSHHCELKWSPETFCLSSMSIKQGKKHEE